MPGHSIGLELQDHILLAFVDLPHTHAHAFSDTHDNHTVINVAEGISRFLYHTIAGFSASGIDSKNASRHTYLPC